MATPLSRRRFLQVGLIGTVTLAAAGGLYRILNTPAPAQKFALGSEAKSALGAIVTAILQGAKPSTSEATELAIARVQAAIAGLPLATQKEIQDLFALLTLAPARRFLAGIPGNWSDAKIADVAAFLESWRAHRFAMLQTAYHALHDLVIGGWYADESTWASIGYPGPIKELS